jgi:fumarylacetoacetase
MTMTPSWVPGAAGSGYDVDHLPYAVIDVAGERRVGVRIGDYALDAGPAAAVAGGTAMATPWTAPSLEPFFAAGPAIWAYARDWLTTVLTDEAHRAVIEPHLRPLGDIAAVMPFRVGDYVDFYASEHHASNLGRMFRPNAEPLLPNWKHLPIGYHGRAQTVVGSGTPITRPCGQMRGPDGGAPVFGPSRRLDIEAELGFVVGAASTLGTPVPASAFAKTVFGVTLVNDWSARDIQSWEYVPLGPFLGKSFATSIGPWITPLAALEAARVPPPARTHPLLPYLADDPDEPWGLDLSLTIEWNGTVVSRPQYASMYYTGAQMLAHTTVNGATVRPGDLYASGTISGPAPEQVGSFIELSDNGRRPVTLADGSTRTFLEDGDTVTITASAPSVSGGRLELGGVTGTIAPARES